MPSTVVLKNWGIISGVAVIIFFAGVFFNSQTAQDNIIMDVKDRQDKKVKIQNENVDAIHSLEKYKAWEEGYREGFKAGKNECK